MPDGGTLRSQDTYEGGCVGRGASWPEYRVKGFPLFGAVLLGQLAIESLFADAGTIEFSHDESILLDEVVNGLLSVLYLMKPLVLINMSLNDIFLGIQNFL
jgi:hypothetical protein